MNIFYVCQNQTYKQESKGQYLWSPQKAKDGTNNAGYKNMSSVKKGDIIFHGARQTTYAISIAQADCYIANQPLEISEVVNESQWNNDGYRVDSKYFLLSNPVNMRSLFGWFKSHYKKNSAFTVTGECKQLYLNILDVEHAKFIINKSLDMEQDINVKLFLEYVLTDILDAKYADYSDGEMDEINDILDETTGLVELPEWKGIISDQEFTYNTETRNPKPKRNITIAVNALIKANHKCEYDFDESKTFYKKSGVKYTEPHHLIPLSQYKFFEYDTGKYRNLDIEENIVSLCSYCHNLLHYGKSEDKIPILKKLYNDRKIALKKAGIDLHSFDELVKFY